MIKHSHKIHIFSINEGGGSRPKEVGPEFPLDLIEQMETIKRLNPKEKLHSKFDYSSPALVMYSGVGGDVGKISAPTHARIQILMALYLNDTTNLNTLLREAKNLAQGGKGMIDYERYSRQFNIPLVGRVNK